MKIGIVQVIVPHVFHLASESDIQIIPNCQFVKRKAEPGQGKDLACVSHPAYGVKMPKLGKAGDEPMYGQQKKSWCEASI